MQSRKVVPYGFEDSSFQAAGGIDGVQQLVTSFYEHIVSQPQAREIHSMHSDDLATAKEKLTRFLCGWLGGPKLYQEKYGSIDIPAAHQSLKLNSEHGDAWLQCMDLAIDVQPYSEKFTTYLKAQFRIPVERILSKSVL